MSDPPRRRPIPVITRQKTDDERPSRSSEVTDPAAVGPEPPTVPASMPSTAKPMIARPGLAPASVPSITAPSFTEAARAGGPPGKKPRGTREDNAWAMAERAGTLTEVAVLTPLQKGPADEPPHRAETIAEPAFAPTALRMGMPDLPRSSTVFDPAFAPTVRRGLLDPPGASGAEAEDAPDPWEYRAVSEQEAGGVELDEAGRLVAPGHRSAKNREDSGVTATPADLLSVPLEVWPDAPPPTPVMTPPSSSRTAEPVVTPLVSHRRESAPEPPTTPRGAPAAGPEPTTAPRSDPGRRAVGPPPARTPSSRKPKVEAVDTVPSVHRGQRAPEPEEELYEEPGRALEEEYGDEYDEALAESATRLKPGLRVPTSPRGRSRSRWPGRLLMLLLLAATGAGGWLWYTGQWSAVLAWVWPR